MPKGRGLGLSIEVKAGKFLSRAKRYASAKKLLTDFDWPHPAFLLTRNWKRHRKTQYKQEET